MLVLSAELGSFQRAQESLQSAMCCVSHGISNLEVICSELFDRISVTQPGH